MRRQRGIIPVTLILYGLAAIAIIAAVAYIYRSVKESGRAEVRAEWAEANRLQREAEADKAGAASTTLEGKREKAKIVYRTITREVDRIVASEPVRECLSDDGLRLAAAAIRGESPAAGEPDQRVPGAPGPL